MENFKYFHKLRITGKSYLIPADASTQHPDTNEEIVLLIVNRNLEAILEYDYSDYEDRVKTVLNYLEDYKREEEKLKAEYSNFRGNRDFADNNYEINLKRTDGLDGTYVNNGYR